MPTTSAPVSRAGWPVTGADTVALTQDIVATYRGPGRVVKRLLEKGRSEPFALSIAMAGCVVAFVAQWPKISRDAYLNGGESEGALSYYSAFLGLIFVTPVILYALAAVSHLVARLLGGKGSGYGARMAIFWAFLASSPLALFYGMVAGFIGTGQQESIAQFLWFAVFVWFWIAGLRQAEWGMK